MPKNYEELALAYHEKEPRGKIAIRNTKPLSSQEELSLAYSPGVAGPCRAIEKDQNCSFQYTGRGNLVGVVSNGTAVLGLGNIGAYAAKPVMEGKAMLFKKFANIDVFDIEINETDPDKFIDMVAALEPTFGGINLEDIKAPECFYIEEKLRERMQIPVFHDDQHGTSIIAGAAFINALEVAGKSLGQVRIVFSGAGAAAIACADLMKELGVPNEHILLCDSKGVIHSERQDLNKYKQRFAHKTRLRTLTEALDGADAFIGVSGADLLTPAMIVKMAKNPIIFALANPDPEIRPEVALAARPDAILATGRSDYPNQVNNVLGFPYIFRGALDARATTINTAMKLAAVWAIAGLAKEPVPEDVLAVYNTSSAYRFGREYLIPKPVDQRVLLRVAPAVAKAAIDSGVARIKFSIEEYQEKINALLGTRRRIVRGVRKELEVKFAPKQRKPRIVLPYGYDERVLRAAKQAYDGGDVDITLLGGEKKINQVAQRMGIPSLVGIEIINPLTDARTETYAEEVYQLRKRKGVSRTFADQVVHNHDYFAATMVRLGEMDGMINGVTASYNDSIRPILQIIGVAPTRILAGVYMVIIDEQLFFFADCTVNIEPSAEEIADIALSTAELAQKFLREPVRIAMLSFASFGANKTAQTLKMAQAVKLFAHKKSGFECDGEMQVDVALNRGLREKEFPFCQLGGDANVLIFPDLGTANIGYKLMNQMGKAEVIGPLLVGVNKPAYVMQRSATTDEIVNMIYMSAHRV